MGEKLSFTMDAGVILAKLHRGACQQYKGKGITFINTGMINDAAVDPEKMDSAGKITFDLEAGEYELGVIIDKANVLALKQSVQDMNDEQGEDGGSSDDERRGITDRMSDEERENAEQDNNNEERREMNEDVATQITPGNVLMNVLDTAEQKKDWNNIKDLTNKKNKALKDDVKKMLKDDADAIKKHMEDYMANAEEYLRTYMNVFAGAEQVSNITAAKIAVTFVPDNFADPFKVKNWKSQKYQIPALTDEEVRKMKIEQLKKDPKTKKIQLKNMCFKILYQLSVGK